MRRVPWSLLLALAAGLGLGLVYAWLIAPRPISDAPPGALRADFRDQYRALAAAAYAATGNLPRAQARLAVLGDADPIEALNAQAQRMRASAQTLERADLVAGLAAALQREASGGSAATPTIELVSAGYTFTPSPPPSEDLSGPAGEVPLTLETGTAAIETQTLAVDVTPRPTQTATSTPGEPFALTARETTCDPNLPPGLLQIIVVNRNRRQLAGVEIVITWDGGREQFFTGLKPELGMGYADYILTPGTTYTVQLGRGSDIAGGLTTPTCQRQDGTAFTGGIKLTFQQP